MKKEYEVLLNRINNQIKEYEEKLVKVKKENREKNKELIEFYNNKYIKEAEKISDLLRIIKAFNAVMYYEDIRIYRDHKNMTNRLNNCEQANTDKIFLTAAKQVKDIEKLYELDMVDLLDDKLKVENNGKNKKVNREVSDNKEMIELNKKKDDKEKELEELSEKLEIVRREMKSTSLAQNSCEKELNLMELFKLELIYQVNSDINNCIEESKEKKPYEKPMMRIRRKED